MHDGPVVRRWGAAERLRNIYKSNPVEYTIVKHHDLCQLAFLYRTKKTVVITTLILLLATLGLTSCAKVDYKRDSDWIGYTEHGIASFYARNFQYKKTANGEHFNHHALSAAHKKIPFGSKVKVTNIKNNKSVIVRINDRGPFIRGRVIDLSRHAFSQIGNTRVGIIKVKLEVVE